MKYDLNIKEVNIQPHLDIENEIRKRKSGIFTCILRVNNGNIVDVVTLEYSNAQDYIQLKSVIIEKYSFAYNTREGSTEDRVWADNFNSEFVGGSSSTSEYKHSQTKKSEI